MEKLKTYSKLTSTPEALWAGGAFVLTQDTLGAITKIPSLTEADIPNDAIEAFNLSILDALTAAFQKQKVPIVSVAEKPFYQQLSFLLDQAVADAKQQNARVVVLDRFISSPNQQSGKDYSILSIGRIINSAGEVIGPRPGEPSLEKQIKILAEEITQTGTDSKIILVDDGWWPGCLNAYLQIFQNQSLEVVGFYGGIGPYDRETETGSPGITPGYQAVMPVRNIFDWVCCRDLRFDGGKLFLETKNEKAIYYTIPYFAPFSDGSGASIPPETLIPFSRGVIWANLKLLESIQKKSGRILTFQDISDAGYGLLASITNQIRAAEKEENVIDYLTEALITLQSGTEILFSLEGFEQLPQTPTELPEELNQKAGQVIILFGSSGVGKTTLTQIVINQAPGSTQIKRVTTRPSRNTAEILGIQPTTKEYFLKQVRNGEMLTAGIYRANGELYGVTKREIITQLTNTPNDAFCVFEGTDNAIQLKKLLPQAKLVLVLPPSLKELKNRLITRNQGNVDTRLKRSLQELDITTSKAQAMLEAGIIDMVVVNDNSDRAASLIIQASKNNDQPFEQMKKI